MFLASSLSLGYPLPNTVVVSSGFSKHRCIYSLCRPHNGIDLAAPLGTPVLSAIAGTVIYADWSDGGFGKLVKVRQQNTLTYYAHLSEIMVRSGDQVSKGEVVGKVGSTGLSTGPHLHFEFRTFDQREWIPVDPLPLLEKPNPSSS